MLIVVAVVVVDVKYVHYILSGGGDVMGRDVDGGDVMGRDVDGGGGGDGGDGGRRFGGAPQPTESL